MNALWPKTIRPLTFPIAISALALFVSSVTGEPRSLFERLDRDSDGKVTTDEVDSTYQRLLKRLLRTSDENGDVDSWGDLHGIIDRIVTRPSVNAPTALYDVTVEDQKGGDLINSVGIDRSATEVEIAWPYIPAAAADRHQEAVIDCRGRLKISGAGNQTEGLVVFYILDIP